MGKMVARHPTSIRAEGNAKQDPFAEFDSKSIIAARSKCMQRNAGLDAVSRR
jgi:hypothetical protein